VGDLPVSHNSSLISILGVAVQLKVGSRVQYIGVLISGSTPVPLCAECLKRWHEIRFKCVKDYLVFILEKVLQ